MKPINQNDIIKENLTLRQALEGVAWQFGCQGTKNGKEVIHSGCLSAMETAFYVLGWNDPQVVKDIKWIE